MRVPGTILTLVVALVVAVALAGCSTNALGAADPPDGATLVQTRCTRCHAIDRIDAANHDKAGWEATVARMRGKGAQLTDAEAVRVVDYLSAR